MSFNVMTDTYIPDILNIITQGLLTPTLIVILLLLFVALFVLGHILCEVFTERLHYKVNMPKVINQIEDASYGELEQVVLGSGLLRFQKAALVTVIRNMGLPEEALLSLASTQLEKSERRYQRRLAWTDTIAKIGPMLGLMGTLIPLGPGIAALGQNDVTELSSSLLVAFDATVCGLVVAAFCLVISKIRSMWYTNYSSTLEALMNCVIEKADAARKAGEVLPSGYSGDPLKEFSGKAPAWQPAEAVASAAASKAAAEASKASAETSKAADETASLGAVVSTEALKASAEASPVSSASAESVSPIVSVSESSEEQQ